MAPNDIPGCFLGCPEAVLDVEAEDVVIFPWSGHGESGAPVSVSGGARGQESVLQTVNSGNVTVEGHSTALGVSPDCKYPTALFALCRCQSWHRDGVQTAINENCSIMSFLSPVTSEHYSLFSFAASFAREATGRTKGAVKK